VIKEDSLCDFDFVECHKILLHLNIWPMLENVPHTVKNVFSENVE
jgi:hypothetical protein